MTSIVAVTGAGFRGSAGLVADSSDRIGTIEIRFDWREWDDPPPAAGSVIITGTILPAIVVPVDGWATVTTHGDTPEAGRITLDWTALAPMDRGSVGRIFYAVEAPLPYAAGPQASGVGAS
jgi:hypothetical protein